jgi:hypothetical protein
MGQRVAPKQNRGTFLSGSQGVVCPVCSVKLRVLQGRVLISWLMALLLPIGFLSLLQYLSPVDRDSIGGKFRLIEFATIFLGCFVLQTRWTPRLFRLRLVNDGEAVKFPLVVHARERAKELAAEAKWPEDQRELESPDTGKPAWTCAKCREENPGNFDLCWKCQAARPGSS